jgi:hypothetical protein
MSFAVFSQQNPVSYKKRGCKKRKTRSRVWGVRLIISDAEELSAKRCLELLKGLVCYLTATPTRQLGQYNCMWPFSSSAAPSTEDGKADTSELPLLAERAVQHAHVQLESPATLAKHDDFHLTGYPHERLSMPPNIRWPVMLITTTGYGFGLGATIGGRKAADRYRAMNAHRLPSTQAGWYLYHRSKSYHTTLGAVKEGVRFGGVLSIWASMFMLAEEGLDHARARIFAKKNEEVALGQRDALDTTLAALMTAGLYTRWHRMDVFATSNMARMAVKYGLLYGLLQDAVSTFRGERPAYISWIARKVSRSSANT